MPVSSSSAASVNIAVFIVSASVFMHLAARTTLGDTDWKKAPTTVLILFLLAAAITVIGVPILIAGLVIVTAALITVQTVYDETLKNSALLLVAYMVITTIVGAVVGGLARILGLG